MNPDEIYGVASETIQHDGHPDTYTYYPTNTGRHFYSDINQTMRPWDGNGHMLNMAIDPYSKDDQTKYNYTFPKTPKDPSVVNPPFYEDTDRFYNVDLSSNNGVHDFNSISIKIPPVPANGEIIVSYPWYPPNPADYICDANNTHFCLLARIVNPNLQNEGMQLLRDQKVKIMQRIIIISHRRILRYLMLSQER